MATETITDADREVTPRDIRPCDQAATRAMIGAVSLDLMELEAARHRIHSTFELQDQLSHSKAEIERLRAVLRLCLDREYNAFEPDNQSALYHQIEDTLATESQGD